MFRTTTDAYFQVFPTKMSGFIKLDVSENSYSSNWLEFWWDLLWLNMNDEKIQTEPMESIGIEWNGMDQMDYRLL